MCKGVKRGNGGMNKEDEWRVKRKGKKKEEEEEEEDEEEVFKGDNYCEMRV